LERGEVQSHDKIVPQPSQALEEKFSKINLQPMELWQEGWETGSLFNRNKRLMTDFKQQMSVRISLTFGSSIGYEPTLRS